jgi:adenosylcobinamide amidohydrolase
MHLEMRWHRPDGVRLPVAVWCPGPGWRMISSGVAGGGIGPREWVLNAQVAASYSRMDPAAHIAELADGLGLGGEGVGLLTAASVADMVQCEDDGAHAAATAGLRIPAWAAAPPGTADRELAPAWRPGTINIIVSVPVPLSDAAYVNAVMTATEAKTQGRARGGIPRDRHRVGRHEKCRFSSFLSPRHVADLGSSATGGGGRRERPANDVSARPWPSHRAIAGGPSRWHDCLVGGPVGRAWCRMWPECRGTLPCCWHGYCQPGAAWPGRQSPGPFPRLRT